MKFQINTSTNTAKKHFFPSYQKGILYERPVVELIESYCSKGSVFFDVGCNVGFFTLLAASLGASTHSFDIDSSTIVEATRNVRLNKLANVSITTAAIWSSDCQLVSFSSPHNNKTMNSIDISNNALEVVLTLTLDTYCAQVNVVPDIIKIDVEGAEYHVLMGAQNQLAMTRLLILELHPDELVKFHHSASDVIGFISEQGFKVYIVRSHRSDIVPELELITSSTVITSNTMLICTR